MKQTELELKALRDELDKMWKLVLSQLEKSKLAFMNHDIERAHEIIRREKRVNAFDSKIDSDCENYIALYAPVAIDLRLVLSLIKISNTLERIADFADSMARQVLDDDFPALEEELKEKLRLDEIFDTVIAMLYNCFITLESENTKLSGKILATDDFVDKLYYNGLFVLAEYTASKPSKEIAAYALKIMLVLRKLERVGDHCSNIVEEIVFYIDAKVLKHTSPKKRNLE